MGQPAAGFQRTDYGGYAERINERMAKESLIDFEKQYPGVTNTDNVNDIIRNLKKRKEQER